MSYFTHAVGNRLLFAIFSQPILVRWLSGRKQRFAKAPYLSKGTEGSNPSLTALKVMAVRLACALPQTIASRRFEHGSTARALALRKGDA